MRAETGTRGEQSVTVRRRTFSPPVTRTSISGVNRHRPVLVALLSLLLALLPATAAATTTTAPTTAPTAPAAAVGGSPTQAAATRTVPLSSLPPEVEDTYRLIRADGPFPHRQDGTTFQNREGLLPARSSGYYREYTVETPGSDDRGARRIVTGSGGEVYYTADHYGSFVAVDADR